MTLVKTNNRPVTSMFDNLVNDLFSNFQSFPSQNWRQNFPAVNIMETVEGYHLDLVAPGRNKENFALKVDSNLLSISYESSQTEASKEYKQIRKEFTTDAFKRTFTIENNVHVNGITAKYEDGILKVFLPKKEESKPAVKEITIA